jgi:hypothetical protein
MKKIIIALSLVAGTFTIHAQINIAPTFSFKDGDTFDFGTVTEGPAAEHKFVFTNAGESPLVIMNATTSCGCTVANYTKAPVLPGGQGAIDASMTTKGHVGPFTKDVYVQSNAAKGNERYILHIKGMVAAAN